MRNLTFVLSAIIFAQLATLSYAQTTITLDPVADVNTKFNDSVGNGTNIAIKNNNSSGTENTRKGYIRYDLTGVDLSRVTDASWSITYNSGTTGSIFSVYGHLDAVPTNANGRFGDVAWVEGAGALGTDNWNGANHVDAPANSFDSGTYIGGGSGAVGFYGNYTDPMGTPLGTFDTTGAVAGDVLGFDTTELLDFVTSDTNGTLTLMFFSNSTDSGAGTAFAATEHALYAPAQLQLELAAVPEPASVAIWALLGASLLGFGIYRRR